MVRIAVLVFTFAAALLNAAPSRLVSGHTKIVLIAGENAPHLESVGRWLNRASEPLPQPYEWRLQRNKLQVTSSRVSFVYEARNPHLRLYWEWRIRSAPGPIEHSIRIRNLSSSAVWLSLQDSLRFDFRIPAEQSLTQFWVEKGASSPSDEGTHSVPLLPGADWTGTSSTYAHPLKGEPREIIPYLLLQRPNNALYLGIEFSGRTRITLRRKNDSVSGEVGLNPNPGPYRTSLLPGEIFETPTVFFGSSVDADDAGNTLRHWIRSALNNPLTLRNPHYPLLVSNSWGSGMAINQDQAHHMIDDASALGLEMFHLDAGWFRTIGDWTANPEKFPSGIASIAAYAHKRGLRFGLWTDWTQAGLSNINDPKIREWLTTTPPPGWKPEEFKGITVDIGVPAAREWAAHQMTTLIRDTHLDMLEHDGYIVAQGCDRPNHPHAPLDPSQARHYKDEGFLWVEGPNDTDVSYYATRAYYQVQSQLRRQFPNLLFEICDDGGRMVDFGSAANGDYFSITDAYDPLSNRRAFYDASYVLPSAMLETYVQKWPTPNIENFRYMLRSGMLGWFSLMMDSNTWTPEQHAAAKAEFSLYKQRLRPLIRQANLYHVSPRPTPEHWDGMEYFDPTSQNGVLFAFHGTAEGEATHTFPIKGLNPLRSYRISFQDHPTENYTASGAHLIKAGITVHSPSPNSSELIFISALSSPAKPPSTRLPAPF